MFLYKRAQIFIADLWGAFKGQSYGEFNDIGSITIMADYIIPAVLRQLGVLTYSSTLASTIEANSEIGPGSEEEVELRACSVHAVEKMRELISMKLGKQVWLIFFVYCRFRCRFIYMHMEDFFFSLFKVENAKYMCFFFPILVFFSPIFPTYILVSPCVYCYAATQFNSFTNTQQSVHVCVR